MSSESAQQPGAPERAIRADLSGRVALVTGASRGIGRAIALRLGAAGAFVVANYAGSEAQAHSLVDEITSAGGQAEAAQADLSDGDAATALVADVARKHGRLDLLINNAGVVKDTLLFSMRPGDWRKVLDLNLDGVYRTMQAAMRPMLQARAGRIINIASVSALRGGRGQANYAAAKSGVVGLTRAAALEVAERGIQINAVLPGFIDTDMTARVQRQGGDQILARIPMGRFGTPDDITGMVLFLCSDDARYITGQSFVVDGGIAVS